MPTAGGSLPFLNDHRGAGAHDVRVIHPTSVATATAVDGVRSTLVARIERVVSLLAGEEVGARSSHEAVIAGPAEDRVVATATVDPVPAAEAADDVVAGRADQPVISCRGGGAASEHDVGQQIHLPHVSHRRVQDQLVHPGVREPRDRVLDRLRTSRHAVFGEPLRVLA